MKELDFENEKSLCHEDEHSTEDLLNRVMKEAGSSLSELLELLKGTDKKMEEKAAEIAGKVFDGKLSKNDEQDVQSAIRQAHFGGTLRQLEKAINKQLKAAGSEFRVEIDDTMAKVQDIGSVSFAVKNSDGKIVCGTVASINNTPQVPHDIDFPRLLPKPNPPADGEPLIIPRLDIPEFPGRKGR